VKFEKIRKIIRDNNIAPVTEDVNKQYMNTNQTETQFSLMAILMGIFNFLHLIQIYTIKDNIDTQHVTS